MSDRKSLTGVRRLSLTEQALEVVRGMIVSGVLPEGTRINEVSLAMQLSISRGPLREAIQRLAAEGLVEVRNSRGSFVKEISADDIAKMREMRAILEVAAARLAAERATADEIAALDKELDRVERLVARQPNAAYPSDNDFHLAVIEMTKNPYVIQASSILQTQMHLARLRSSATPGRAAKALAEHRAVVKAIAAGDGAGAADAMASHLTRSVVFGDPPRAERPATSKKAPARKP